MHNVLLNQARQIYLSVSDRNRVCLMSGTLHLNDAYMERLEIKRSLKMHPLCSENWQSQG